MDILIFTVIYIYIYIYIYMYIYIHILSDFNSIILWSPAKEQFKLFLVYFNIAIPLHTYTHTHPF